jgi:hypothetical protein
MFEPLGILHRRSKTRVSTIKEKTHNKQDARSSDRRDHPQRDSSVIQHFTSSKTISNRTVTAVLNLSALNPEVQKPLRANPRAGQGVFLVKEVAREQDAKGEDHQQTQVQRSTVEFNALAVGVRGLFHD